MKKFVEERTRARLLKFSEALQHVLQHPKDEEALHDLRVSLRRLRQCLKIFADFFTGDGVRRFRRRLRRLMRACGELRNRDVTLQLLETAGIQDSALAEGLRADRARLEAELLATLQGLEDKLRWTPAVRSPKGGSRDSGRLLSGLAAELLTQGDAAVSGDDPEALHQFRLTGKRFRYSVELFPDEPGTGRLLQTMKRLQDRLGAINDCVTALGLIQGHAEGTDAISRLLRRRIGVLRRVWPRLRGELSS